MITNIVENFPESLIRENIKNLQSYSTARDENDNVYGTFLDANESPFNTGYNRYPDPHQKQLKRALASAKGDISEEMIFAGNGSDEAIDLIIRAFCTPGKDNVLSVYPTYGMYKVAAAVNDIDYREVPLRSNFSLDTNALLNLSDANSKVIFLCSPNNPTGNLLNKDDIIYLINNFNGIVVVDEAYSDFSEDKGFIPLLKMYPNLIVLQTMSKSMGMAALRVGFAFGNEKVIAYLNKIKYPYNLNRFSQEYAIRRLEEGAKSIGIIVSERERVSRRLSELPDVINVYESSTNFILVKFKNAPEVYKLLLNNGIIVRDRSKTKGCEGCLRITIGKIAENDKLISIISSIGNASFKLTKSPFTEISRITKETSVTIKADFTGGGQSYINTGIGFFDHMLDQICTHAGVSLDIDVNGDLKIDPHHTIEDVAIVLGETINRYFTTVGSYQRYGFSLPMDESEATVVIDLGGRSFFKWSAEFKGDKIGEFPCEMFSHFFSTLSSAGKFTLHIKATGDNDHHKAEAIFKAFARALKSAVAQSVSGEIPSSKGLI